MKDILIIMSDNREINDNYDECDYNTLTATINYNYCLKNNYDFKYLRPRINNQFPLHNCVSLKNNLRHSSWSKLLSTIYCIENFKEYEYILYIDSDCIFNNLNESIKNHFKNLKVLGDKSLDNFGFLFLNDRPWHPLQPCAGFYILKNGEISKNILKRWYSLENNNYDLKHPWEQILLYRMFESEYKDNLVIVDDIMFIDDSPNQFLRHVGTHEKQNRLPLFKTKIKNLNLNDRFKKLTHEIKSNIIEYDTLELINSIYKL